MQFLAFQLLQCRNIHSIKENGCQLATSTILSLREQKFLIQGHRTSECQSNKLEFLDVGPLPSALSTTSVYSTDYSQKTFAKGDIFSNLVLIIFFTEPLIQASVNTVTFQSYVKSSSSSKLRLNLILQYLQLNQHCKGLIPLSIFLSRLAA